MFLGLLLEVKPDLLSDVSKDRIALIDCLSGVLSDNIFKLVVKILQEVFGTKSDEVLKILANFFTYIVGLYLSLIHI